MRLFVGGNSTTSIGGCSFVVCVFVGAWLVAVGEKLPDDVALVVTVLL